MKRKVRVLGIILSDGPFISDVVMQDVQIFTAHTDFDVMVDLDNGKPP